MKATTGGQKDGKCFFMSIGTPCHFKAGITIFASLTRWL